MKPGTGPEGADRSERFDLVSIGETMVGFVSRGDPRRFLATMAGAESNVAAGMAQLGCRTRWVSRLGDDPLGRWLEEEIGGRGVDVAVVRDAARPTGVLTKHVADAGSVVRYYRSESAARQLSVDDLQRVGRTDRIHVSGITPALSPSAAGLVEAVVERSAGLAGRVSLDVNYRPALWPDAATAAPVLLELARRADVVFVGDDEAEALFGTSSLSATAELILRRDDQELVLKRGAQGATIVTGDTAVTEPAFPAELVDATGAGDAFAAGYLAAAAFGWSHRDRLRLGHLMGARVVGVLDDVPPPFAPGELEQMTPDWLAARSGAA
jgi:2-dehydro-3-deoxygluconokinase